MGRVALFRDTPTVNDDHRPTALPLLRTGGDDDYVEGVLVVKV